MQYHVDSFLDWLQVNDIVIRSVKILILIANDK